MPDRMGLHEYGLEQQSYKLLSFFWSASYPNKFMQFTLFLRAFL